MRKLKTISKKDLSEDLPDTFYASKIEQIAQWRTLKYIVAQQMFP